MLLPPLIVVELIGLYTLHGERPPAISIFRHGRRSSELSCNLSDNSERRGDVELMVGDTECPLQVCQLSRSLESTHFRSFVDM